MLKVQLSEKAPATAGAFAFPVFSDDLKKSTSGNADIDLKQLKALGFKGNTGECKSFIREKAKKSEVLIAVGLGKKEKFTSAVLRTASSSLVKAASNFKSVASHLLDAVKSEKPKDRPAFIQAHAEGLILGSYKYSKYKSQSGTPKGKSSKTRKDKPDVELSQVFLVASKNSQNNKLLSNAKAIAEAVLFARDLVNEPGGSLTPQQFVSHTQALARKAGIRSKVWNKAAIEKAGMGGLLGVNRGSSQPPRFLELHYTPKAKASGHLALVGKGVTFDSGGLSIKPANYMMTMKCDMSGAAAVVSAIYAIAKLRLPIKVSAYTPLTDNMLGGDATRPGDVLITHNKKTIEVLNTDAEGRLILADALSIASKAKPDAIVDLATLTGACVVALGEDIAGLMGNSEGFVSQIKDASKSTDEKVWELPLVEEYKPMIESTVADMKNIGGNYAGTITAALLLQEFVDEKIPWAHIDIAGPAFKESGAVIGGTGFGVRLLVELASNFKKPKVN